MKTLKLPVDVQEVRLAILRLSREEIVAIFGPGILPEHESSMMAGPIQVWPFETEDGQVVVIEHSLRTGSTALLANPPDVDRAIAALHIAADRVLWRIPVEAYGPKTRTSS